jgi:ATP-dependent protease HslVU (ClpYQ) peptidase subunit
MTTIAFDRTHIAWDSQGTLGNEKVGYPLQKVWTVGKVIYGFAGDYAYADPVVQWHAKGARPRSAADITGGSWEMLVISAKGANLYTNETLFRTPLNEPFAIGSGSHFARGALLAKVPAYQAVRIAAICDVYTGGEINSLAFSEVFGNASILRDTR